MTRDAGYEQGKAGDKGWWQEGVRPEGRAREGGCLRGCLTGAAALEPRSRRDCCSLSAQHGGKRRGAAAQRWKKAEEGCRGISLFDSAGRKRGQRSGEICAAARAGCCRGEAARA